MKLMEQIFNRPQWVGIFLITLLTACGGSGNDNTEDRSITLSGSVFASAVSSARCEVKNSNDDQITDPFTTSATGNYSISLPSDRSTEDLIVKCTGGTFTDEATGQTNSVAGTMAAYITGGTSSMGSSIHITPASTIIHDLITRHSKTVVEATTQFEAAFGFTPDLTVAPTDVTQPADGADNASLRAGLRAATFSQLASDLGLSSSEQFALFSALADDLSVGSLDGQAASGAITINGTSMILPADIQNRFGLALVRFRNGTHDASGLANNDIGLLPFAKIAMTDSYSIEYIPSMYGAINGKTEFTLKVSDPGGTLQTGLDVSIKPKMHMNNMVHSTPFEAACNESITNGEYGCTLYYLMPSIMMNGMSMGFWELKVMIGGQDGEQATFHPAVKMAMDDTAQVRLKGQNDKISSAMNSNNETENRTYFLFKSKLTGMTDNHHFELFIAAKENMMNFPAISTGSTLNSGDMNHELSIITMSVKVSTDASNWVDATEKEGHKGYWIASNISGLNDGEAGMIYVKLDIEGEQKTTDGNSPNAQPATDDTNNHYAKFSVTPDGRSAMSM